MQATHEEWKAKHFKAEEQWNEKVRKLEEERDHYKSLWKNKG